MSKEKETQPVKEKAENFVEEIIDEKEKNEQLIGYKKIFQNIGKFISSKFLTPTVITVFITAIIGPIAVKWVNDSFQNKVLQKEVIETVIAYTNEADFTKPESIEKIAIISQMVNENKDIFGLDFTETFESIRQLNEASNDAGIKGLNNKLNEYIENIESHKTKFQADSILLNNLEVQKIEFEKELDKYKEKNKKDKIKETEEKLAYIEIDIQELEKSENFNRKQVSYWTKEKRQIEEDIEKASKDLATVLDKNRDTQEMLKQEKNELKEDLSKTLVDIQVLENQIEELKSELQIKSDSIEYFKRKLETN